MPLSKTTINFAEKRNIEVTFHSGTKLIVVRIHDTVVCKYKQKEDTKKFSLYYTNNRVDSLFDKYFHLTDGKEFRSVLSLVNIHRSLILM